MANVYTLEAEKFDSFKKHLKRLGFSFEERPHQVFLARYDKFTVNLYKSGKITFGGTDKIQNEVVWFIEKKLGGKSTAVLPGVGLQGKLRIGTDEAGKGDFFGPLVVTGVMVTADNENSLASAGVKDSKLIRSDKRISEIANAIRSIVGKDGYEIVMIGPERYNKLYDKIRNLNKLLGWAHARTIENLVSQNKECRLAVADQFGDPKYIKDALMSKGREIELVQVHKGERDIAIASASILARDRFIKALGRMSNEFDIDFPRGSSKEVRYAAGRFVEEYSRDELVKVAKLHFSIYTDL